MFLIKKQYPSSCIEYQDYQSNFSVNGDKSYWEIFNMNSSFYENKQKLCPSTSSDGIKVFVVESSV